MIGLPVNYLFFLNTIHARGKPDVRRLTDDEKNSVTCDDHLPSTRCERTIVRKAALHTSDCLKLPFARIAFRRENFARL